MANISEEKWIEMLEKKADGSYIAKYPKVKSKSGITFDEHLITFDEHLAEKATVETLGHVKAETDAEGKLILGVPKSNYNADRPPDKDDDITKGYEVGSQWLIPNPLTRTYFICTGNAPSQATWEKVSMSSKYELYTRGNEMESVTGGWKKQVSPGTGEATKHGTYFSFYGYDYHGFYTGIKIDVSEFDSIKALVSIVSNNYTPSGISLQLHEVEPNSNYQVTYNYISRTSVRGDEDFEGVMTLDTTTLKGEYYLYIGTNDRTTGRANRVYEIWGERL